METIEYKRRIIEKIEQIDETDKKFLCQVLLLLQMHMEKTGKR